MKEAGIITWFGTANYGSNLQAYGLATTIKALGYDPFFVEGFKVNKHFLKHPMLILARGINKINKRRNRQFFVPIPYEISESRKKRIEDYKRINYKARKIVADTEWKKILQERTIFVSGSDLVWNPARGYPAMNFLDFAYYAKLPRFSYGSSVGALDLPKKYYRAYRRYLGSMVEVGVREQSVADILEPIIRRKVTKVADPSLLLTAKEWDAFASKAEVSVPVSKEGFILCYFVMNDPRYWEYVKKIREITDKQIIVLPMHHLDEEQPYDVILDGTPYEFIWLIKNAEFICTDSFHACAVSLIYQKDFYLLRRTRKAEDAKYDDFLNRYHLTDRTVSDESEFIQKPQTDYSFAQIQLEKDREFSFDFLRKAIAECEAH